MKMEFHSVVKIKRKIKEKAHSASDFISYQPAQGPSYLNVLGGNISTPSGRHQQSTLSVVIFDCK